MTLFLTIPGALRVEFGLPVCTLSSVIAPTSTPWVHFTRGSLTSRGVPWGQVVSVTSGLVPFPERISVLVTVPTPPAVLVLVRLVPAPDGGGFSAGVGCRLGRADDAPG